MNYYTQEQIDKAHAVNLEDFSVRRMIPLSKAAENTAGQHMTA